MTVEQHARQLERVKMSLLLGVRPTPRPPKPERDVREAAIRRMSGGWRH
jgi:hypothetical protein